MFLSIFGNRCLDLQFDVASVREVVEVFDQNFFGKFQVIDYESRASKEPIVSDHFGSWVQLTDTVDHLNEANL